MHWIVLVSRWRVIAKWALRHATTAIFQEAIACEFDPYLASLNGQIKERVCVRVCLCVCVRCVFGGGALCSDAGLRVPACVRVCV